MSKSHVLPTLSSSSRETAVKEKHLDSTLLAINILRTLQMTRAMTAQ